MRHNKIIYKFLIFWNNW